MASSKVEMSLDDIIKANKGKQRKGGIAGKTRGIKKGAEKRKSLKGVAKRKPTGQKNNTQARRLKAGPAKGKKKSVPVLNSATKKLVNKLVKKAISQTQKKQQVIRNVVVPIGRRSVGAVKKTIVLKGVSNRSRVIGRRQRVSILPPTVNLVQSRTPVVYKTSPAIVQIPARRARGRNYRPVIVQQSPQPQIYRQVQPRRGGASIRDQVRAMRQQEVVYVQPKSYRPRQPPRQVYVQEQFNRGQRAYGRVQQRPRQNRSRRVFNKGEPFVDPPNFLQRVPSQNVPPASRRFVYR